MQQSGVSMAGEIVSAAGASHPLTGTVYADHTAELYVGGLTGTGCYFFTLWVNQLQYGSAGQLTGFSGLLQGHCCGTLYGSFHFAQSLTPNLALQRTRSARSSD
jgi:hypothetical protein